MSLLQRPSHLAVVLGAVCLLALFGMLLLPAELPTARGIKAPELPWTLAVAVRADTDTALREINRRRMFGAGPSAAATLAGPPAVAVDEPELTPPDWRIAGVVAEGGAPVVLVATTGQLLVQSLRVNEKLPGGAKILSIHPDRVGLLLNGRRVYLSTYPE